MPRQRMAPGGGPQDQQFSPLDESVYVPIPAITPVGGAAPDLPRDRIGDGFLASALNFVVRRGAVIQREGYETAIGPALASTPVSFFEFIPYNQSALLVAGGLANFLYYEATSATPLWTSITTTARTGAVSNPIFFTPMRTASSGLRLISVNGVDPPTWWSGATSSAFTVLSTAVIGACATVWRSHFIQGNTTDTADGAVGARIRWSALGDPTVWSGTASAGSLDLLDSNASRVMNFVPLRSILMAYKDEGVHNLFYKPDPLYFTQQLVHGTLSLMGAKAVVPIQNGAMHFLLTKEGAIIWDGQTIRAVGRDKVDRTNLTDLNWNARDVIWAQWWGITSEVLLGIATGANTTPNRVWIYNLTYNSWWETDLDFFTAHPAYKTWSVPRLVGARSAGLQVYQLFSGLSDSTSLTAIASSFETGYFDYGEVKQKEMFKLGAMIGPGTGTTTTINLSVAAVENPLVAPVFSTAQALTMSGGSGFPKVDVRRTGRWHTYRLTHTAAAQTVEVRSLIPYLTTRSDARIIR